MFIFFHPDTRAVAHVITYAPENYGQFLTDSGDTNWIETTDDYRIEEIEILPDHTLRRRVPMTLSAPSQVALGAVAQVTGVPEGAQIFINDAPAGVMDATGVLDFDAAVKGFYKLRFEASGFVTQRLDIEVI